MPRPKRLKLIVPGERIDRISMRPPNALPAGGFFEPTEPLGAEAQREWDRIRSLCPWIGPASAQILTERCQRVEILREMKAIVKREGMMIDGAYSKVRHPLLTAQMEHLRWILSADQQLGLTPSSQVKLDQGKDKPVDEIEEVMF